MQSNNIFFLRSLKISLLIFIAALFELSILPGLWPFLIRPDILLILSVVMAMNLGFPGMLIAVLACGALKDAFGAGPFGFNSLVFSLDAFLIYYACRHWYRETASLRFIIVMTVTLLNYLLLGIILRRPYIITGLVEGGLNCLFLPWIERLSTFSYAYK